MSLLTAYSEAGDLENIKKVRVVLLFFFGQLSNFCGFVELSLIDTSVPAGCS